jgi:hypothetical protein
MRPVFTTIVPALYRRKMRHLVPDWLVPGSIDRISAVLPFHNFRCSPALNFFAGLRTGALMSFSSLLLRYFHHRIHH